MPRSECYGRLMRRRVRSAMFVAASVFLTGSALAGAALSASGCGPIEYIATVPLDAAGALKQAQAVNADKWAPYEITAAQEYLHKSRELAGYARFQSSVEFGRKAAAN